MTTAQVERLFYVDIIDTPPPLQVEAVEAVAQPPLAAIAPDPPGDPIPAPSPLPSPPPAPAPPAPAPPGPIATEAHSASAREAAIARRKPRMAAPGSRARGAAPLPHDTRH
jgi:hypothetical protein